MLFTYKGYDSNSVKCDGSIEASSLEDASKKLQSQKIIYNSLKAKGSLGFKLDFLTKKSFLLSSSREYQKT